VQDTTTVHNRRKRVCNEENPAWAKSLGWEKNKKLKGQLTWKMVRIGKWRGNKSSR
jgi:hypothetical protein